MNKKIKYSFLFVLAIFASCSDIEENTDAIKDIEGQLAITNQDLTALKNLVNTLQEKTEQDIQILKEGINAITQTIATLESRISTLEGDVSDLLSQVSTLKEKLEELQNKLAAIEARLEVVEASIDELGNQVITLVGEVDYKSYNISYSDSTRSAYDSWLVLGSPHIKQNSTVMWAVKFDENDDDWAEFSNVRNDDLIGLDADESISADFAEVNKRNLCFWRYDVVNNKSYYSKHNGNFSFGAFTQEGSVWIDMPCGYYWLLKNTPVQYVTNPSNVNSATSIYGSNVESKQLSFTSGSQISFSTDIGKTYTMRVTGSYGVAFGHLADAAYNYQSNYTVKSNPDKYMAWSWNGLNTQRPDIDEYNSSHTYNYTFVASETTQTLRFTDGGGYGDNSGSLTFSLGEESEMEPIYKSYFDAVDTDAKLLIKLTVINKVESN